jgi:hypothetical protein
MERMLSPLEELKSFHPEAVEPIIPPTATALELFQVIYQNADLPLRTRMQAARDAIPFESPKLAVTASMPVDESFAALLDRARKRSDKVRVIEARPEPERPSTVEIKPHLPTVPDRRYRRY